jgi:hypothetical protein
MSKQTRAEYVQTIDLDPQSLVGSWFHMVEDEEIVWQGVVVGEPQAGVYLCQIDRLGLGVERVQKLIDLNTMIGLEDDQTSREFRFYDDADTARVAYANYVATRELMRS